MTELLKNLVFPYYAHCQAGICPPLASIAWNKVALSGYIEILLSIKEKTFPASYHRKLMAFYSLYEKEIKSHPLLGEIDTLSRNLAHLDLTNSQLVTTFASRWAVALHELETFCIDQISQQKMVERENLLESLQVLVFNLQEQAELPGWTELLNQQQEEVLKLFQLNNYPKAALAKFNMRHQFSAVFQTEKAPVAALLNEDQELKEIVRDFSKTFLKLVNSTNQKLPAPNRHLRVNPNEQDLSLPQDYRLTVSFTYNGNDQSEFEANFFSALRHLLK
ncbi:MAG TPA: hypothetical protein VHY08_19920 [Bacillota bacterium]|nr:hypothetical protein [Bacillota bacterium]